MHRQQAYKFIKIYEDKGLNVLSTKQSSIDALYYTATLPEQERAIGLKSFDVEHFRCRLQVQTNSNFDVEKIPL